MSSAFFFLSRSLFLPTTLPACPASPPALSFSLTCQLLPVPVVLGQVDLLHRPEGGDGLLVHRKDVGVPDGKGEGREGGGEAPRAWDGVVRSAWGQGGVVAVTLLGWPIGGDRGRAGATRLRPIGRPSLALGTVAGISLGARREARRPRRRTKKRACGRILFCFFVWAGRDRGTPPTAFRHAFPPAAAPRSPRDGRGGLSPPHFLLSLSTKRT